jgi:hypothetical protein
MCIQKIGVKDHTHREWFGEIFRYRSRHSFSGGAVVELPPMASMVMLTQKEGAINSTATTKYEFCWVQIDANGNFGRATRSEGEANKEGIGWQKPNAVATIGCVTEYNPADQVTKCECYRRLEAG